MSDTLPSRTISVTIEMPAPQVYDFVSRPENLPKWASGLGSSLERVAGQWIVTTPQGKVVVRFTEPNAFGVLDHYVCPEGAPEIYVPMRVVANGGGSEVSFTLFRQPGMSEERFAEDADWVRRDLASLKMLLES